MSYKFMPFVVGTTPKNMSVDVPTSVDISIVFSTDMDPASLPGNIIVQTTSEGVKVEGSLSYRDKTAVFRPVRPLDPGTAYTVIVAGDTNLEDGKQEGVRSILGYPMAGVHTFSFTTAVPEELSAPLPLRPANMTAVEAGQLQLAWSAVQGAAAYEVQVAASPEMEPLLWQTISQETAVVPDYAFSTGSYFWRVRCLDGNGNPGAWSGVVSFAATDSISGTIEEAPAGATEHVGASLVVPEDRLGVDPGLGALVVRLPFSVRPEDVRVRLVGKSVAGDPTADHGLVPVVVSVDSQGAATLITITAQGEGS